MHFTDQEFLLLVCPMYTSQMVDLLRKLYEWSIVDPHNIDDEKYLFAKKFSEVCLFNSPNFLSNPVIDDLKSR
jgi:exportin-5